LGVTELAAIWLQKQPGIAEDDNCEAPVRQCCRPPAIVRCAGKVGFGATAAILNLRETVSFTPANRQSVGSNEESLGCQFWT